MESRHGDVYPGPYVPEFAPSILDSEFPGNPFSVFNSRINAPLNMHSVRVPSSHNGLIDTKSEPAKSARRDAYNYYTPSNRYAESGKYDDIARNLYNTLASPVLEQEASKLSSTSPFKNLSPKQRHERRVRMKRFACRYVSCVWL